MTRKDYIALAGALRYVKPKGEANVPIVINAAAKMQWEDDVRAIAVALRTDNYRFDTEKFFAAVGLKSE